MKLLCIMAVMCIANNVQFLFYHPLNIIYTYESQNLAEYSDNNVFQSDT